MQAQFLIAAPASGSGKTTVTLALLRYLANTGYKVQSFKCGPDYIDTHHHTFAARMPGINLDLFMMSANHVNDLYSTYTAKADIALTEGVMGLFDGATKMKGSSAEIAKLLKLPIILVINAKAMAYSVAPLIYGFKNFDPEINIAGVIFNFVNTASHYNILKEACETIGVTAFGYVPASTEINIPSRHLGLAISSEYNYNAIIEKAAAHIAKTVNVESILACCSVNLTRNSLSEAVKHPAKNIKIAVAKDEAFTFTYHQNIEVLKQHGQVVFFSPLYDTALPDADIVYIAGGYPELHLQQLAANKTMRAAIYNYAHAGGKLFAECGGLMYLGKTIIDEKGNNYSGVGYLDIETSMLNAKLSLGYRNVIVDDKTYKGHEFHYSSLKELTEEKSIGSVYSARDIKVDTKLYHKQNVIASYIHFYWGNSVVENSMINLLMKI